jgi:hypothetical protein
MNELKETTFCWPCQSRKMETRQFVNLRILWWVHLIGFTLIIALMMGLYLFAMINLFIPHPGRQYPKHQESKVIEKSPTAVARSGFLTDSEMRSVYAILVAFLLPIPAFPFGLITSILLIVAINRLPSEARVRSLTILSVLQLIFFLIGVGMSFGAFIAVKSGNYFVAMAASLLYFAHIVCFYVLSDRLSTIYFKLEDNQSLLGYIEV